MVLLSYTKKEVIDRWKVQENDAACILVNPCLTIIASSRKPHIHHMDAIQVFSGSTQKLLVGKPLSYSDWSFQEFLLGYMLNYLDPWEDVSELGEERFEWKFENERLLIKTHLRSYFRDFNVCEDKVDRFAYKWKQQAKYDLREVNVMNGTKGESKVETKEKNSFDLPKIRENKNHEKLKGKGQNQNWKKVEKKEMTEEKEERKQIKKKGDKYYKNVRQDKHSQKNV